MTSNFFSRGIVALALLTAGAISLPAQTPPADSARRLSSSTVSGLRFRSLGPALTSGRVGDIAIHPGDKRVWYVGASSGGVWKSVNAGTTWTPIFDGQASYSIGALAIDPADPLVVWVGTGENNSQRSVGYGDGVYKSVDGGRTWRNVGLKESGNIGRIAIDPRDGDAVYVAAQGPMWSGGGERGLYKTTDGGGTWTQVLKGDNEWTGANEVHLDPRDPDVVYATTWQRMRRQWGFINGGPGSGIHKSTDGGKTWRKLSSGLPNEDLGKIALAVAPSDPNTIYATVEAANRESGIFRSSDAGSSWRRMSRYSPSSPMYYSELIPDPKEVGRLYSIDVQLMMSSDSGRSFAGLPGRRKHVDHHALWIDPDDTGHLVTGNDGGLYESFDRGATWRYAANLPLTQFYRVALDSSKPFYNIYGGTQDNNTIGGPSRTTASRGIANEDWFIVVGGDGFWPAIDPIDPNIVYGESQHGGLVRLDRRTGERIRIVPQPGRGEEPLRWHWDAPLIISPHAPTRLYFAAQRLFRSDDRGDSWRAVSGDLTRRIDRNRLKMMGRVWSVDAVAKNTSTSLYGAIVMVAESPVREGLIYVGTDDGLIQVTEDGGQTWRRIDRFPGVPDTTFVSDLAPSRHDPGTVYATFNNHKAGDYKPYVLKSTDLGRTWTSITGDLPARGSTWAIVEDHVRPGLLFVGTEFGVFFTPDGGQRWIQLKGGLPTISVRDLAIQSREDDLVLATFGRGFYVLDDYSPLRSVTPDLLAADATLLPVQSSEMFIPSSTDAGSQGDGFFTASNPPAGATFTYHLGKAVRSRREERRERERAAARKDQDTPYPAWDSLRQEDREEDAAIVLTVTEESGAVIRQMTGPTSAGFQRVTWDLRWPSATPVTSLPRRGGDDDDDAPPPGFGGPAGPLAVPGTYRVQLAKRVDGVLTPIGAPQPFTAEPIGTPSLPAADRAALLAFQRQTARLQRAVMGAVQVVNETLNQLRLLRAALDQTPNAATALRDEARALERGVLDLQVRLAGDRTIGSRAEPAMPGIVARVQSIVGGHWQTTANPTATHRRDYEIAAAEFGEVLPQLRRLVETDLKGLFDRAEAAGAPWTPGRVPRWEP
jgi:photosystem II stability/assembly factor-like uncharacterized protein